MLLTAINVTDNRDTQKANKDLYIAIHFGFYSMYLHSQAFRFVLNVSKPSYNIPNNT